jgi:DNA-binding CsgD family transcriptional regulator
MTTRIENARLISSEILKEMDAEIWVKERDRTIIRRVLSGETYERVGVDFGLSPDGVRLACFRMFRKLKFKL